MPEPNWYPPTPPPRETITFAGETFPSMTLEEFQAYEARLRGELPDEPLREATGYRDNPCSTASSHQGLFNGAYHLGQLDNCHVCHGFAAVFARRVRSSAAAAWRGITEWFK